MSRCAQYYQNKQAIIIDVSRESSYAPNQTACPLEAGPRDKRSMCPDVTTLTGVSCILLSRHLLAR